jgi:hypothetical protein
MFSMRAIQMKYQEKNTIGSSAPVGKASLIERSLSGVSIEGRNQKKRKGKKKLAGNKPIGSAKGIETMFRNAYRAELDLIALAATKANIMISLNGLIVSAIMISGGFLNVGVTTALHFFPMILFILTSCISIYFALLAASPQATHTDKGLVAWIKGIFHGETTFNNIKNYTRFNQGYIEGESNLLIYADRSKLSKKEYWIRMRELLGNQELIYEKMSDQLYWLGMITNTKFSMLSISYAVFRWGLVISMMIFLFIEMLDYFSPVIKIDSNVVMEGVVSKFEGVYEPSAIQPLPGGRVLIVEDEPSRALSIVQFNSDKIPVEDPSIDKKLIHAFDQKLSDLEAVTMDRHGYIYTTTSHSVNHKGKRKNQREKIFRFKIRDNSATEISVYTGLIDSLLSLNIFQNSAMGDINIEAMGFDRDGENLLLGLRSPLVDGKSVIIVIENPVEVFEKEVPLRLAQSPILLDLNGGGIRSLEYDPGLNAYLIINEIEGEDGKKQSRLWLWSGNKDKNPIQVTSDKIARLKNIESIAPITINGVDQLLLVSDDGNLIKDKPAHYMLLGYDSLLFRSVSTENDL